MVAFGSVPRQDFILDHRDAVKRGLSFINTARIGSQRNTTALKPCSPDFERLEELDAAGRDKRFLLTVHHSEGSVTFDRVTGQMFHAFLRRQERPALTQPPSNEECFSLAINAVRSTGWKGELYIDPSTVQHQSPSTNDPGYLQIYVQPEGGGIRFDPSHSFRVAIDLRTGAVHQFKADVPNPPLAIKKSIDTTSAEGAAFQVIAKAQNRQEFFLESSTEIVIVRPPARNAENAGLYEHEIQANLGVPAYRVSFSTPFTESEDLRDYWTAWIDAEQGRVIHLVGGSPNLALGKARSEPVYKFGWPSTLGPVVVIGTKGKRSAFGAIRSAEGSVGADLKAVTLRFRDRLLMAKFDPKSNLLVIGRKVGHPTGHLAEALRAVTR